MLVRVCRLEHGMEGPVGGLGFHKYQSSAAAGFES
jgi:hypothetical protein